MDIVKIVELVNKDLAGERLSYDKMIPLLDRAIDDINIKLNSTYPVFSELPQGATVYDLFPDRYIRTVVIPGVVWRFYVVDEEGINSAPQFGVDYERGLFYMVRDYITQVPPQYQGGQTGIVFESDTEEGPRGLSVNVNHIL